MDQTKRPSIVRRMIGAVWRTALTLGVVAGAGLAVMAGQAALSERLSAQDGPPPAPATTVRVARIALQPGYEGERRFAGQFEPRQEVRLGFEEGGTIAEIRVSEGDHVSEGAVVATLDTRLLEAERAQLAASRAAIDAQVELARRTNQRQAELRQRGFATDQTVDDTSLSLARLEAQVAEIDAATAALDVRLSKAVLRAPFAGPVGDRLLDVGAIAEPGTPVVTLLQDGPVLFRAGLDPALAGDLSVDDPVRVLVGDRMFAARLVRTAPELEAGTRARTAFFEVEGSAPPSRALGEVSFARTVDAPAPGAWLPLAALRQGPRGTWQVVTVEESEGGPVAGIEAVEIIHAQGDRAFVSGTIRDGMRYVPEGSHRIVPGERLTLGDGSAPDAASEGEVAAWAR
jgi:RND family efflux transporter MFP subunit